MRSTKLTESQRIAISQDKISAIIFDLDGVVTSTAKLHFAAWKKMFDEYLEKKSGRGNFRPFEESDYLRYVDGKPRYDGVKDFLVSRKIRLPQGTSDDSPDSETVCGLGNRKNKYFLEIINKEKPKVYQTSVDFIRSIRGKGMKTAIISSSRNCAQVLRVTGTDILFDARVDGTDLESLNIPGKPDPAMFLEAAKRIGVIPERDAIVEDSLAGVEAGRRGNFGLVIGVARSGDGKRLKERGADVVVSDLKDLQVNGSGN
jgi:beta-phosphoglucomutase family hydrolase